MDKDPAEKLDYTFDWTAWLGTDTIQTYTVTVPTGITKISDSVNAGKVVVWLSGGTVGTMYNIVCHVITAAGREGERTIALVIVDR